MFDFQQFVHDSWVWLFTTLTGLIGVFNWKTVNRLESRINTKVSKDIYEAEKKIPHPVESEIKIIKTYLKLLLDKEGIEYHDQ